ncbi:MAG TPA: BON domain-containing protein [Gammaproteobacteria bacterium]
MEAKHLVGRIREALATDPRTNVLDVTIKVAGGKAFIIGEVTSDERKQAARKVVTEVLPPDIELVDELWIAKYDEPGRPETLG